MLEQYEVILETIVTVQYGRNGASTGDRAFGITISKSGFNTLLLFTPVRW